MSADGAAGSDAVYVTPPIARLTDASGSAGAKAPLEDAADVMGNVPDAGAFTVTTAKRIELSGHRVLTSDCVGKLPTCRPAGARPCGTAWPNVAQPALNPTVPIRAW